MKKLWLGRYIPTSSSYHNLDPRAKIIIMFLNVLMIIMISSWTQLLIGFLFMICFLSVSYTHLDVYQRQAKRIRLLILLLLRIAYRRFGYL